VVETGSGAWVLAACLADLGHAVTLLARDPSLAPALAAGTLTCSEPGVADLMVMHHMASRLEVSDRAPPERTPILTPLWPGEPDLADLLPRLRPWAGPGTDWVLVGSVPVGGADWLAMQLEREVHACAPVGVGTERESPVVCCHPVFWRTGQALHDALHPDRIVVGARSDRAIALMRTLLAPLLPPERPEGEVAFVATDPPTAELLGQAVTAYLATKRSFTNELSSLAERIGADPEALSLGLGLDPRIGPDGLAAGLGWAEPALAQGVSTLIELAGEYDQPVPLLQAAWTVNHGRPRWLMAKLQRELKILKGRAIALWGLTDPQGHEAIAPALAIARLLSRAGALVRVFDPVDPVPEGPDPRIIPCPSAPEAAREVDAIVLLAPWPEFADLDLAALRALVRTPLLFDSCQGLCPETVTTAGFRYVGLGR